jgi:hypothetical protein
MSVKTKTYGAILRYKLGTAVTEEEFNVITHLSEVEHNSLAGMGRYLILEALKARGYDLPGFSELRDPARRR